MQKAKVIRVIEQAGALLVYPVQNQPEPPSLWHALYPKSRMSWDWADSADNRVVDLWHLRTELSTSRKVVYAKWYQGRATFFSRPLFVGLLRLLNPTLTSSLALTAEGAETYRLLLDDTPQTPRLLRQALGLEGKTNEAAFNRGMNELWRRLLIVGFGELDEGSFPSLQVGATKLLFEDLWDEAGALSRDDAETRVNQALPPDSAFARQFRRLIKKSNINIK